MASGIFTSLAALVLVAGTSATASQAADPQSAMAKGIQQAQEGEYQAAESTLRSAVDLLMRTRPQLKPELVRAYVYLAVAYVGMGRQDLARTAFGEALKLDPTVETSAREFPPALVEFFDGVRRDAVASGAIPPPRKAATKTSAPRTGPASTGKAEAGRAATGTHSGAAGASGKGTARWLIIGGGVAAAGAGAAVLLGGKNAAPDLASISVSPSGAGISGVTSFSFSASVSDPNGDPLTLTWDFGDQTPQVVTHGADPVTHVYGTISGAVPFKVNVSVSDGKLSAAPRAPVDVTVGTLSALWVSTAPDPADAGKTIERTWALTQNGQDITGTYNNSVYPSTPGHCQGRVTSPRSIVIRSTIIESFDFTGEVNESLTEIAGVATGAGHTDTQLTFRRQ